MTVHWIDAGTVTELDALGIATHGPVTVVKDGDRIHACASRCPHMGYPMRKGTVREGVITCAWHNWEFDLDHGGCYRGACDDLAIFPVRIANGRVSVQLHGQHLVEHESLAALHDALLAGDPWLQAKALAGLLALGWDNARVAAEALRLDFRHSVATHQTERAAAESQAIVDAAALADGCDADRRLQILLQGLRQAGGPSGDRMRMRPLPPPYDNDRLFARLADYIADPSRLGIERICLSLRDAGVDADRIWAALLQAVVQPAFLDQRQGFWAVTAARLSAEGFDDPLAPEALALAAWAAGTAREQPDAECGPALAWLQEHRSMIDATVLDEGEQDPLVIEELAGQLTAALAGNRVEAVLAPLLDSASGGANLATLLGACEHIAARRMAALSPNNGGMWNAAVEGLRACFALRRATTLVPGSYSLRALLLIAFGFFRQRWLPSGSGFAVTAASDDAAGLYRSAFRSGDRDNLRRATVGLLTGNGSRNWQAWLAPLVDEDLDVAQLELLAMVADAWRREVDWRPLACGVATWIMDGRGQQTVRPAARFGRSMLGSTSFSFTSDDR